jgi:hypothetical protein
MTQSHLIPRITKSKVEDEDKIGNVTLPDNTNNIEQNSTSSVQDQVNEWYEQTKNSLTEENNDLIEKPEDQTADQVKESKQQLQVELIEEENEIEQREFEIIKPEDYVLEDLSTYSSQFKDRIIIHLDQEVKRLSNQS